MKQKFGLFRFGLKNAGWSKSRASSAIPLGPNDMLFAAQIAAGPVNLYKGYDFDGGMSLPDFGSRNITLTRQTYIGTAPSGDAPVVSQYKDIQYLNVKQSMNVLISRAVSPAVNVANGYSFEALMVRSSSGLAGRNNFSVNVATNKTVGVEFLLSHFGSPLKAQITSYHYTSGSYKSFTSTTNYSGPSAHVVATWDPADGKARHYVNGSLVATSAALTAPDVANGGVWPLYPSSNQTLGANNAAYDRTLSASEILANYGSLGLDLSTY
jgi:hypothetical protein